MKVSIISAGNQVYTVLRLSSYARKGMIWSQLCDPYSMPIFRPFKVKITKIVYHLPLQKTGFLQILMLHGRHFNASL